MTQEEKHFLNLAGEFLVAGELNRRQVMCSVTYGFSKQADVIALGMKTRKSVWIEVKTTNRQEFIVGDKALDERFVSPDTFWVLVHLPDNKKQPPRYFVLSSEELHKRAKSHFESYNKQYRERHGHDYDQPGVHKLGIEEVNDYESKWQKIESAIND